MVASSTDPETLRVFTDTSEISCAKLRHPSSSHSADFGSSEPAHAPVSNDNQQADDGQPFADAAVAMARQRLAVIPVGGPDGKEPQIRWRHLRYPFAEKSLTKMMSRHARANVGVLTGRISGVTVVDVDAPEQLEAVIARFGDTPLKASTPSGGVHLYFRYDGEGCSNLRNEGLDVDVKGDGGFVVAPPSIRPSGQHIGRPYAFVSGSWSDLKRLPRLRDGSLPSTSPATARAAPAVTSLRNVAKGARNDTLYRMLLRVVKSCDSEDQLLDAAVTMVAQHFEHDPDDIITTAEIEKTVRSAWKTECEGRNWVGAESRVTVLGPELDILAANPDALTLLMILRRNHGGREAPFAVAPKAMAANGVIPGWATPRRYMTARDWLLDKGFLNRVHKGGRGTGDPDLFTLSSQAIGKGAGIAPNITKHPLLLHRQGEGDDPGEARRSAGAPKTSPRGRGDGQDRASARLIKGAA